MIGLPNQSPGARGLEDASAEPDQHCVLGLSLWKLLSARWTADEAGWKSSHSARAKFRLHGKGTQESMGADSWGEGGLGQGIVGDEQRFLRS